MTRLERDDDDAAVAADEVRWITSGVPVKAVAVAMTSARSRAVMAALMVGEILCGRGGDVLVDNINKYSNTYKSFPPKR